MGDPEAVEMLAGFDYFEGLLMDLPGLGRRFLAVVEVVLERKRNQRSRKVWRFLTLSNGYRRQRGEKPPVL